MIAHGIDGETGLFVQFACDGFFDALAGLDETGKGGKHALREHFLTPQKGFVPKGCQHDDHRVGARKMLGFARRAGPLVASFGHLGHRPAHCAMAVAGMPVQHRFRLSKDGQFAGGQVAHHANRAQILKSAKAFKGPVIFRVLEAGNIMGKQGFATLVDAQKHLCAFWGRRHDQINRHPAHILASPFLGFRQHQRFQPPQRDTQACAVCQPFTQPGGVGAAMACPVQRVIGKNVGIGFQCHEPCLQCQCREIREY